MLFTCCCLAAVVLLQLERHLDAEAPGVDVGAEGRGQGEGLFPLGLDLGLPLGAGGLDVIHVPAEAPDVVFEAVEIPEAGVQGVRGGVTVEAAFAGVQGLAVLTRQVAPHELAENVVLQGAQEALGRLLLYLEHEAEHDPHVLLVVQHDVVGGLGQHGLGELEGGRGGVLVGLVGVFADFERQIASGFGGLEVGVGPEAEAGGDAEDDSDLDEGAGLHGFSSLRYGKQDVKEQAYGNSQTLILPRGRWFLARNQGVYYYIFWIKSQGVEGGVRMRCSDLPFKALLCYNNRIKFQKIMDIDEILKQVIAHKAPDLHLKVGKPPVIRQTNGDLFVTDKMDSLTVESILEIAKKVAGEVKFMIFEKEKEVDFSYGNPEVGRFRVNLYQDKEGPSMAFRSIPSDPPSVEALGLPKILGDLVMKPRGLVLVTGPTGSGKSTTLAAMVDHVNRNRKCHIITIEDPIEFIHKSKSALITQREVSSHTNSFSSAIRSALRQDPDVVLVGEMRDLETIAAAITLAETGHLVLSTLHTTDAAQTVDRMIDVFPAYQQQQIRAQLSVGLLGVVSQTLVPRLDGKGRAAAFEIMMVNDAIKNCVKEGETHQIYSMLQIGKSEGMQTLDDSLADLVASGKVSPEAAMAKAHDIESFKQKLSTFTPPNPPS